MRTGSSIELHKIIRLGLDQNQKRNLKKSEN